MCTGAEAPVAAEAGAKGATEIAASEATIGAATSAGSAAATGLEAAEATGIAATAPPAAAAVTGSDLLSTIKTLAPAVSAGASLLGAGAAVQTAKAAGNAPKPGALPTPPTAVAPAVDADLTAIRKKNALLFGADSPASTDLTSGQAGIGNIGKSLLLGGSSKLGS